MKKITTICLLLLATFTYTATAQKIEFYTCTQPAQVLPTGGKIYIQNLENKGTSEAEFGSRYAAQLRTALNLNRHGFNSEVKLYNPWLTTKLYQVVDNAQEADYIIGGEYTITSASNASYSENWIAETDAELAHKLPICFYKYTMNNEAKLTGKLVISKQDGTVINSFPLNQESKNEDRKIMEKAKATDVSKLITTISNAAITQYKYAWTPSLEVEKYRFQGVKTKNKELKAEFKELDKQIDALIKTGDINEAGKKYLEVASKEESEDVNQNIAVCYEIIGNLTQAKAYYIKAVDKKGLERVNKMITIQALLRAHGLPVVENEF